MRFVFSASDNTVLWYPIYLCVCMCLCVFVFNQIFSLRSQWRTRLNPIFQLNVVGNDLIEIQLSIHEYNSTNTTNNNWKRIVYENQSSYFCFHSNVYLTPQFEYMSLSHPPRTRTLNASTVIHKTYIRYLLFRITYSSSSEI